MKLLIELDEEYVKAIDKIRFLVGGRTDRKLQLEIIKAIKNGKPLEQEPTTKNDLGVDAEDCISRKAVFKIMDDIETAIHDGEGFDYSEWCGKVYNLPPITPQEPRCKDCKWWKDSDGEYRRGRGAESQCPINRREVFKGNGYCYLFEPQESEG